MKIFTTDFTDAHGWAGIPDHLNQGPYAWREVPLEGNYSLTFDALYKGDLSNRVPIDYALIQRGDIPADAKFLIFTYWEKPFEVSINGITLSRGFEPLVAPSSGYTTAANVEQFAGMKDVELKFTPARDLFNESIGLHTIDAIGFIVPEQSCVSLIGVGVAGWLLLARRRRD